ncbi:MAG TPA: DUF2188 domain-containing protein [Drouetiella sp.]
MINHGVCQINRWVVRDNEGTIIERFNTQTQAIDFANRLQKKQRGIVLIDVNACALQLINHAAFAEEKVSA